MDKEDVTHIYYSAIKRNEPELFVVRWMDLETVVQSELSQKKKNKYRMLTHICGILKKTTATVRYKLVVARVRGLEAWKNG